MYKPLVFEKMSSNGVGVLAEVPSEGDDVDTDQIASILTQLQVDGARRDEKLTHISTSVDELTRASNARVAIIDTKFDLIAADMRDIQARTKELEDAGIAAWSLKKIAQAAALITTVGVVWGFVAGIVVWLVMHFKV